MTIPIPSWQRDLQTIFNAGALAGLSDGELLEQIAVHRGAGHEEGLEVESAFALLMERHGPMVLRVCRGVLGDPHEADDAFQATFLVLFRQAGSIRKRESVGPWLHGVAHRVAACARSAEARRHIHERRWFERRRGVSTASGPHDVELAQTIHAELDRLPERYRAPIVLCDLEERSLDEAARQLGWPLGTVKSRLNRGREQLRDRLVRRGVAPGVAGLVLSSSAAIRPAAAAIAVSPALVRTTAHLIGGAGTVDVGSSASVLALAKAMQRIILMSQLRMAAVALIVVGLTAMGIGAVASGPRPIARDDAPSRAVAAKAGTSARANEDKPAPAPAPKRNLVGSEESHIETIDVSGRATDPSGRPVAGATVFVIDTNLRTISGKSLLLATATTGPDGRYFARDVELPVWKPAASPIPTAEEGRFQVAGTASGFGLTWHAIACYRPEARPSATPVKPGASEPEAFHRGEPIAVDLPFGPPASITGKLVDDRGRPLAGVKVQVGIIDHRGGKMWSCNRVDPTDTLPRERRAFDGIRALPEEPFSTRTGADGTYRIDGLPREAELLCSIDPGPEYQSMDDTIATTTRAVPNVRSLGYAGVLDHPFVSPRDVRLAVRYADSNLPARNAIVRAMTNREMLRAGSVGETDDNGRTTLRLRPGEYDLAIEPPPGAVYRPGRVSARIGQEAVAEIAELKLEPAARVTLEAVDARTGVGIAGVSFQYETDTSRQRRSLPSQPVFADHPATDERGQLRAVVEPGRRQFFVESVPAGWKLESIPNVFVELAAGPEITVRITFQKLEPAEEKSASGQTHPIFREALVAKWRVQNHRLQTGKFRIREYFLQADDSIRWSDLEAFLQTTDLSQVGDLPAVIRPRFPGFRDPGIKFSQVVVDGPRRRNTYRFSQSAATSVIVSNEWETVRYDGNNQQADVFDARKGGLGAMGVSGFSHTPYVADRPARIVARGEATPTIRRTEGADGRLTIEAEWGTGRARWVVDPKTGFVHSYSSGTKGNSFSREVRQFDPKIFENSVVLPTVFVDATISSDRVNYVWVRRVEAVDLAYHPTPRDFVVSAPAETVILDYREDLAHPKQGMNRYPVADVIIYADGISSRNRSIDPVLKTGQPAPRLEPKIWLDRNGPVAAPDLKGKVVLIDFWGITCGFCVVQLPEVQAVADHFASRSQDFVLIGLHDSGGTVDQVAEFARKRGLTYHLAIDRPAAEEGWFGATSQEYGVRAIPAAAVIDRQGKIAFVGRFPEALQKAAELLGPEPARGGR